MWRSAGIGRGRRIIQLPFRSGCSWIMCGYFSNKYEHEIKDILFVCGAIGERLFVQQKRKYTHSDDTPGQHNGPRRFAGGVLADQSGYEPTVAKTEYGVE